MTVEVANLENVPEIIALCYKDFDEVGSGREKPDTIKALKSMCDFVNMGLVFVKRGENGTIVGILALSPFTFWWSDVNVLQIAVIYVLPEYRKNRIADELLKEAKEFADVNEVKMYLDIPEKDLERKGIYLERKEFKKTGEVFCYSPK